MVFLNDTDFKGIIGANTLASLRGDSDDNLNTAEAMAISELAPLEGNYNIAAELLKTDDSRNAELVRIMVHITAYYLYNTAESEAIPIRVDENYNNVRRDLGKIASGSLHTTITPLYDSSSNPISNYKFGGDALRDNDIF